MEWKWTAVTLTMGTGKAETCNPQSSRDWFWKQCHESSPQKFLTANKCNLGRFAGTGNQARINSCTKSMVQFGYFKTLAYPLKMVMSSTEITFSNLVWTSLTIFTDRHTHVTLFYEYLLPQCSLWLESWRLLWETGLVLQSPVLMQHCPKQPCVTARDAHTPTSSAQNPVCQPWTGCWFFYDWFDCSSTRSWLFNQLLHSIPP